MGKEQAPAIWDRFAKYFHSQPGYVFPSCIGRLALMHGFIL